MRRPSLACQVEGCPADLSTLRSYFQRQHICEEHARADAIHDGRGGYLRFCQQCTKLEPLSAFEGHKRSCRASLAKRHMRRSGGRRAASAADLATRSYSSAEADDGGNTSPSDGYGAIQRAAAFAAVAAAGEQRGSPCSVSRPGEGGGRASAAPAQLAALLEAALPPLPPDEAAAVGAAAAAAAAGGLSQHQQGPVPLSTADLKGSSILDGPPENQLSSHLPPLRAMASQGPFRGPLASVGGAEASASLLAAVLGGGTGSPPGSAPSGATAFTVARPSGDASTGALPGASASELLPYLASVLSSRTTAEAPGALLEQQQQQDLEQLLTALQMLQTLQGLIGGIVVGQLQQQLARVEAAALLDQQLLPLLAGIQARQAAAAAAATASGCPPGERAEARGVQGQLDHILGQLGQLVGVLQAQPPPQLTAQVLAAQQHAAAAQRQQLAAAARGGAVAAGQHGPAPTPDQLQALLHRMQHTLKRPE